MLCDFYFFLNISLYLLVCGKAWSNINGESDDGFILSPMAVLVSELSLYCKHMSPGTIVVGCSDVMLDLVSSTDACPIIFPDGVTVVAVPEELNTAKNHVCMISNYYRLMSAHFYFDRKCYYWFQNRECLFRPQNQNLVETMILLRWLNVIYKNPAYRIWRALAPCMVRITLLHGLIQVFSNSVN